MLHSAFRTPHSALTLIFAFSLWVQSGLAQDDSSRWVALAEDHFKRGEVTLKAFKPIAEAARRSLVKLQIEGQTVALGAVIDTNGFVLTKASELQSGPLKAILAQGQEVAATVVATDQDNDVALVKVEAAGLKPIEWVAKEATLGQWAVTPGLEAQPEAIGIVSAPPRKIPHQRAFMGVELTNTPAAQIIRVVPNLGAAKAGLKPGDIVLAVNEVAVKATAELITLLRDFRAGQQVKLRLQRDGQEIEVSVEMSVPQAERSWRGINRPDFMNRLGGELSRRAEDFEQALQHDTVLQPWQCGGPLVDLDGKALGLNIARAGRTASYALPAKLVQQIIQELKAQKPAQEIQSRKTSSP